MAFQDFLVQLASAMQGGGVPPARLPVGTGIAGMGSANMQLVDPNFHAPPPGRLPVGTGIAGMGSANMQPVDPNFHAPPPGRLPVGTGIAGMGSANMQLVDPNFHPPQMPMGTGIAGMGGQRGSSYTQITPPIRSDSGVRDFTGTNPPPLAAPNLQGGALARQFYLQNVNAMPPGMRDYYGDGSRFMELSPEEAQLALLAMQGYVQQAGQRDMQSASGPSAQSQYGDRRLETIGL